jgi:hypothetical protein
MHKAGQNRSRFGIPFSTDDIIEIIGAGSDPRSAHWADRADPEESSKFLEKNKKFEFSKP